MSKRRVANEIHRELDIVLDDCFKALIGRAKQGKHIYLKKRLKALRQILLEATDEQLLKHQGLVSCEYLREIGAIG